MIESRDAVFLNRVINDPSVFPDVALGCKEALDAARLLANPRNHFLANEFGGFLFLDRGDGLYEAHAQFLPAGRGKWAQQCAREALAFMFLGTDCMEVSAFCPNRKVVGFVRGIGMSKRGVQCVLGVDGKMYSITIKEWLCQ